MTGDDFISLRLHDSTNIRRFCSYFIPKTNQKDLVDQELKGQFSGIGTVGFAMAMHPDDAGSIPITDKEHTG